MVIFRYEFYIIRAGSSGFDAVPVEIFIYNIGSR